jgi:two-component system, NarL family, response regulator DevR
MILVDDHQLVRTGIANLLSGEPGFEIIGEAADAKELFDLLRQSQPDIAVLDIALPNPVDAHFRRIYF